jgi:hypothetical protein
VVVAMMVMTAEAELIGIAVRIELVLTDCRLNKQELADVCRGWLICGGMRGMVCWGVMVWVGGNGDGAFRNLGHLVSHRTMANLLKRRGISGRSSAKPVGDRHSCEQTDRSLLCLLPIRGICLVKPKT